MANSYVAALWLLPACAPMCCASSSHPPARAFQPYAAHSNTIHIATADLDGVGARDHVGETTLISRLWQLCSCGVRVEFVWSSCGVRVGMAAHELLALARSHMRRRRSCERVSAPGHDRRPHGRQPSVDRRDGLFPHHAGRRQEQQSDGRAGQPAAARRGWAVAGAGRSRTASPQPDRQPFVTPGIIGSWGGGLLRGRRI
jgi:hypothetical protein